MDPKCHDRGQVSQGRFVLPRGKSWFWTGGIAPKWKAMSSSSVKGHSLLHSRSTAAHLTGISWWNSWHPDPRVGGERLSFGRRGCRLCARSRWSGSALLWSKRTLVSNSKKTSRWPKRRGGHVKLCLQLSLQEFSGPTKIRRVGGRDCCGRKSPEEGWRGTFNPRTCVPCRARGAECLRCFIPSWEATSIFLYPWRCNNIPSWMSLHI